VTPLILALDTTHESGSLALVRGSDTVEEVVLRAPDGFAQVLYAHIAALLERNGLALRDVDCFAAASGPGSFTGVRVGLACIKGLAEALDKPAAAVSNLRAIASLGTAPLRAAVMDARRGEVYGAVYSAAGEIVVPETVGPLAAWLETLPAGVEFVSTDFSRFQPPLAGTAAPEALAAAIGRLAGAGGDPASLDANYVRRSDAELLWKEQM
jgi:tRNA threonylcarbamoyladenosine biosynthesis protein TsaB